MSTNILSDEEIDKIGVAHTTYASFLDIKKIGRAIERAVIEKMGGDVQPVAVLRAFAGEVTGMFAGADQLAKRPIDDADRAVAANGGFELMAVYDATALAQARQQGYTEGYEAARAEDVQINNMVANAWSRFHVALAVDDIGNRFSDEQGNIPQDSWDDFARAILDAARQSTQQEPT